MNQNPLRKHITQILENSLSICMKRIPLKYRDGKY